MPAFNHDHQLIMIALTRLSLVRPELAAQTREIARAFDGEAFYDRFLGPDPPRAYITCPICRMTSYLADDVSHRYCQDCHRDHDEMTGKEIAEATAKRARAGRSPAQRHLELA